MIPGLRTVPVLLVAFVVSGCPAVAATGALTQARVSADATGSDLGNGRPTVTHDGLMVRRRVVIAVHPASDARLAPLHEQLDSAATRRHTTLTTVSPTVLDPAVLARFTPQLVQLLPAGDTPDDARTLIAAATSTGGASPEARDYTVASVLVHDLRFTVRAAAPAALARAIAREGILSDALGNYTTALGRHQLDITYTGPLLSDDLVESVRAGIARRAQLPPTVVKVLPRTTTGVGVDMATEPVPAPAPFVTGAATHQHGAVPDQGASAQDVTAAPSPTDGFWTLFVVALGAVLVPLAVVQSIRTRRRGNQPDGATSAGTVTDAGHQP